MDTMGSSCVEGRISAMLCPTSRMRVEPALPVITTASSPSARRVIWKFSARVVEPMLLMRRGEASNPIMTISMIVECFKQEILGVNPQTYA